MNAIVQIFIKILSVVLSILLGFMSSSTGKWGDQLDSLQSIKKVADNYYLMDYTYDYDLDTLLASNTGNSTTVGMLLYSAADVFLQLNPEEKKLIADLGLYVDIEDHNNNVMVYMYEVDGNIVDLVYYIYD